MPKHTDIKLEISHIERLEFTARRDDAGLFEAFGKQLNEWPVRISIGGVEFTCEETMDRNEDRTTSAWYAPE